MTYKTVLLVQDLSGELQWSPFHFNIESVQDYYLDPDDSSNMNVIINGMSFTVPYDITLIDYIDFDERKVL